MRPYRSTPLLIGFFQNVLPDGAHGLIFCWEDEEANVPMADLEFAQGDWVYKKTDFTGESSVTNVFLWDEDPIGIECERLGVLVSFGTSDQGINYLEFDT